MEILAGIRLTALFTAVFLALMMHQSMGRRERRLDGRIAEGSLESAFVSGDLSYVDASRFALGMTAERHSG
jgi:hypothetical protein